MRDGVNLSTDVYLPNAGGPSPTVLVRTPYGNNMDVYIRKARALANDGYAWVVQGVRGRGVGIRTASTTPLVAEPHDGYDTQKWLGSRAGATARSACRAARIWGQCGGSAPRCGAGS